MSQQQTCPPTFHGDLRSVLCRLSFRGAPPCQRPFRRARHGKRNGAKNGCFPRRFSGKRHEKASNLEPCLSPFCASTVTDRSMARSDPSVVPTSVPYKKNGTERSEIRLGTSSEVYIICDKQRSVPDRSIECAWTLPLPRPYLRDPSNTRLMIFQQSFFINYLCSVICILCST